MSGSGVARRFAIHGVPVTLVSATADVVTSALARFAELDSASLEPLAPTVALGIAVRARARGEPFAALPRGAEPLFFNGGLRAHRAHRAPRAAGQGAGQAVDAGQAAEPDAGEADGDVLFTLVDGPARARLRAGGSSVNGPRAVALEFEVADEVPDEAVASVTSLAQIALVLALRHAGVFHLHAGGVVDEAGRGVVLVGPSGSGKTSTTLALALAGFAFVGDDSLLLHRAPAARAPAAWAPAGGGLRLGAMPRDLHVSEATAAMFPALAALLGAPYGATGKRSLDPRDLARAAAPGSALAFGSSIDEPRLLLFPEIVSGPETSLERLSQADALGELLAASASFAIHGAPRVDESVAAVADLARAAPAFALRLGADAKAAPLSVVPPLVRAALRESGASAARR